ncbi:hypothetical protein B1J93_17885 [Leptospira kirschneri serovar Pomona]|uniref:Uncharacterized protein n=1 Tax=Leptospira kirschneri serovar Pomona TaxID=561005 RepID=A0A1T1DH56_9LEPT|nr:hypothetical protein B1J93_17885 [Leptospira kirschneri serovar Pomona]
MPEAFQFLGTEFRYGVKVNDKILQKAIALTILISSKANEEARVNGQDVLFRRDNFLIRRKPDGEEIVLKELTPRVSHFPTEYDLS